jgi:ribosome-associated protein
MLISGCLLKTKLCYNQRREITLESIDKAKRIVELAGDKLASDVLLLETREVCGFADYFVIVSGESARQLDAISEEISHSLKKEEGIVPLHHEGTSSSGWIILDYGDVVVHIFSPVERERYRLDEIWSSARPLIRMA